MDVPRGIQYENVSRFFRENVPGGDCELSFEQISGGRSNITYLARGGGEEWVLRRPPLGHVLPTAHDMAREYRVLTALRDTNVPVPRTYALCEDRDVNDMPFYVMEYCPGIVLADDIPAGYAESNEERREISLNLVETLTRLHAVDYRDVGLGEFGHPEGYIERQVRRWSQQWERSKTDELPEIEDLIVRLRAALPESPPPTIVHGDYRLGNMALDPDDPGRILAIFDWEMATLGDPLADLGYTLIYWYEEDDLRPASLPSVTARPGFLKRADLIEEYAKRSGRDVSAIDFYQVLALYKLAIISEGIYARHRRHRPARHRHRKQILGPSPPRHNALARLFDGSRERCGLRARRALLQAHPADRATRDAATPRPEATCARSRLIEAHRDVRLAPFLSSSRQTTGPMMQDPASQAPPADAARR